MMAMQAAVLHPTKALVECPALVAGLRILPKAFFWRDGADLAKHFARTSVGRLIDRMLLDFGSRFRPFP
jgi:hypothetical protein